MLRYIQDQFNDKHLSTIQAAFMKKKLKIGNNSIELAVWVIINDTITSVHSFIML